MKNIFLITCAIGMFILSTNTVNGNNNVGLSKVITGNTESVFEHRTIVPYPYPNINKNPNQEIPTSPLIETMPFFDSEFTPHIRPYIRIAPNPEGRGLGTDFGIDFGIFRSHGLRFGIDFF